MYVPKRIFEILVGELLLEPGSRPGEIKGWPNCPQEAVPASAELLPSTEEDGPAARGHSSSHHSHHKHRCCRAHRTWLGTCSRSPGDTALAPAVVSCQSGRLSGCPDTEITLLETHVMKPPVQHTPSWESRLCPAWKFKRQVTLPARAVTQMSLAVR